MYLFMCTHVIKLVWRSHQVSTTLLDQKLDVPHIIAIFRACRTMANTASINLANKTFVITGGNSGKSLGWHHAQVADRARDQNMLRLMTQLSQIARISRYVGSRGPSQVIIP